MRDALNSNPLVQAAVLGVLVIGAALFLLSSSGGGSPEEESAGSEAGVSQTEPGATPEGEAVTGEAGGAALEGSSQASVSSVLAEAGAPPLPKPVIDAFEANRTVVLLIVHDGGIDDRLVKNAANGLSGFRNAAVFVVPASMISRYAAITEGVGVEQVPALVVVRPKHLDGSLPTASVSYGFQSPESIAQAVIDAGYKGPTLDYHP